MHETEFGIVAPGFVGLHAMLAGLRLSLRSRQLSWALKSNYNPAQPRVARGLPGGGQWTDDGVGSPASRQTPPDAGPSRVGDQVKPVRVAQSSRGPRGSGPRRVGGGNRIVEPTLAEEVELAATRLMLDVALQRVRAVDPRWKPSPSYTETIRGEIMSNAAQAREAEVRFYVLQRNGIGPGPFAAESLPARSPSRSFTREEREEISRIGRETGCHTCGAKSSGFANDIFFKDHQLPSRWNQQLGSQRIFPQC